MGDDMCQRSSIIACAQLWQGMVITGEAVHWTEGMQEITTQSYQFFYEPKKKKTFK
jgi:hypothetical protein